jgi:threonine aldolase
MREAMAAAEVGDDVYGEDPTVNALEEEAADLIGKEAAVFVPSGSMGNLLGLATQSRPGEEVLCVETAHVRNYEMGAAAALSGLQFRTVATMSGEIQPSEVESFTEQSGYHFPRISLLSWENTHNWSGGTVVPLELMQATTGVARSNGLRVHLDGARLWNAVAATGIDAADFGDVADTVQFCFSKGLGAPIGSILCGSEEVIAEARFLRKRLGGGLRQVGVIAAAAVVALQSRARLVEDHALARAMAERIAQRHPDAVSLDQVQTNMVLVHDPGLPVSAEELRSALAEAGVLVGAISKHTLRFVTHRDVDEADLDRLLDIVDSF